MVIISHPKVAIHRPGEFLYALQDKFEGSSKRVPSGFLTWQERDTIAVLLFSSGEKSERYANQVYPERRLHVYPIAKRASKSFALQMLDSGVEYAMIDLPPEHVDPFADESVVRNYAIIDLKKAYNLLSR